MLRRRRSELQQMRKGSSLDHSMDHHRWHKHSVQLNWNKLKVVVEHLPLARQDQAVLKNVQLRDLILAKSAVYFHSLRILADNRYSSKVMLEIVMAVSGLHH
jgi:hypothetical protein